MSSRGNRRWSRRIAAFGLSLALLGGFSFGAAAQNSYEPPGAPRMPARGSAPSSAAEATASKSAAEAGRELVAAAKAGDPEAQRKLGLALLAIKPPKPDEALKWFRQAADKGNAAAASHIGEMYGMGLGVPKNETEAAKWYRQGATGGHAFAQNALGQLYENGRGVPQDYAEALKWYRLSADQKFAAAQNNLGVLYAKGHGVPVDQAEAVRLYRLSADQGNAFGQLNLGFQYVNGRGVPMSSQAAYFWLNLAASRLPANATAIRDQVARARDIEAAKLGPADLQRLQQMAGAWTPGSTAVPTGTEVAAAGAPHPPVVSGAVAPGSARVSGTGFVVGQSGFVVTNNHVAGECREVRAHHNADSLGIATVVAKDALNDLTLLKLPSRYPDAAVFREDRGLRQGDNVVVYGFPLVGMLTPQGNLTTGSISALSGLGNDSRMLQVSAPVQPGNSGGPLLDGGGNVIGVVSSKLNALKTAAATGDIPQNVNFAIKASVVRNFLDANGVDYRTTAETRELKTADVGDRAKKFTLYIECMR